MADPAPITERIIEPAGVTVARAIDSSVARPVFSFTGEDVLEVTSWNSAAGVRIAVQGRIYGDAGVVPFSEKHTPATNRTATTTIVTLPRGELLNAIVFCDQGAPAVGQTGVRVSVRRGSGTAFERLGVIIQGVVTATQALAFPGSPVRSLLETEPFLRLITGTAPAVGVEFSETCPAGARWELIQVMAPLTTSVAAPVRTPSLRIGTAVVACGLYVMNSSFGPSVTWFNCWGQASGASFSGSATRQHNSIPQRCMLRAADFFSSNTVGLDAGDLWGAPVYSIREWLDV